ncbi:unnamed protein product [Polarella glacialis]|uniref:Uncharacterized protein n=1 Tax=Polarella glacialis TaxID=89957 RepID=A0A813J6D9_POLGL|nr:unnamed protein product [Polarella glacialis]
MAKAVPVKQSAVSLLLLLLFLVVVVLLLLLVVVLWLLCCCCCCCYYRRCCCPHHRHCPSRMSLKQTANCARQNQKHQHTTKSIQEPQQKL